MYINATLRSDETGEHDHVPLELCYAVSGEGIDAAPKLTWRLAVFDRQAASGLWGGYLMVAKTILLFWCLCCLLSACNLPASAPSSPVPSIAPVAVLTSAAQCWSGPGEAYPAAAALSPGQSAEVVGRTQDGAYLLVRDPANPAVMCWINSAMTTVVGDLVAIPVYVVPAPPTFVSGCPSPIGGGPTPVSCTGSVVAGCPSPIGGGPTPVSLYGVGCSRAARARSAAGQPL